MSLKLITTEKFGEFDCNFYRNMNDDILLTREQIGTALEYSNPHKAIEQIHLRHKERLDKFSMRIKIGTLQSGAPLSKSEEQEKIYYTTKGVMEICRWSQKSKADLFMDFVWDVMDKLIHGQPIGNIDLNAYVTSITSIFQNQFDNFKSEIKQISNSKRFKGVNRWKSHIFEKCHLLAEYLDVPLKTVLSNLFMETENAYEIDFSEYAEECILQTGDTNPYTLNIIDCNNDLRKIFECTIDSILNKYELEYCNENKRRTIFDETRFEVKK